MTDSSDLASRLKAELAAQNREPERLLLGDGQWIEILYRAPESEGGQIVYTTGVPDPDSGELPIFVGLPRPDGRLDPCPFLRAAQLLLRLEEELPDRPAPAPSPDGPSPEEAADIPEEEAGFSEAADIPEAFEVPEALEIPELPDLPDPPVSEADRTAEALERAKALEAEGKPLEAAEAYAEALSLGRLGGKLLLNTNYDCGRCFHKAGQPERALPYLLEAAQAGHGRAQLACGAMYQNGQGTEPDLEQARYWYQKVQDEKAEAAYAMGTTYRKSDPAEAFRWYKQAAEQGHALAQAALGSMYDLGDAPGGRDKEESLRWYELAARQGVEDAQYLAGLQYLRGQGTAINCQKAFFWLQKVAGKKANAAFQCAKICLKNLVPEPGADAGMRFLRQAAEQTLPEACTYYGSILSSGAYGQTADKLEGFRWIALGAQHGDAEGQYLLGISFRQGKMLPKDPEKAVYWLQKAADQNHPDALFQMGQSFRLGSGVRKDPPKALAYYQKALDRRSRYASNAAFWCGVMYSGNEDGIPQDYAKGMEFFRRGERLGNRDCIRAVGENYYYGRGVEEDYDKALQQFQKAAEKKDYVALYLLGRMHYYGQGVPADKAKAFTYYDQSAKLGYAKSGGQCAAMCYDGDGVKKDKALALQYAEPAAQDTAQGPGDSLAQCVYGMLCYYGFRGFPKNREKGADYLRRAADQEHDGAQYLYGCILLGGKGVPTDQDKGMEYLRKSSAHGNPKAARILKLFDS